MAMLPSDEGNADSRLQVRFYKRAMPQEQETLEAGRPIYKEFDFVHICVAGDSLTEIDTYVTNEHKKRFPGKRFLFYELIRDPCVPKLTCHDALGKNA